MTITKLLKAAPFDEKTRQDILQNLNSYTEDQKREITELAWTMIAAQYQADYDEMTDLAMVDAEKNNKPFTPEDVAAIKKKADIHVQERFEQAESEEQIAEVQKEIQQQTPWTQQDSSWKNTSVNVY